jgi:hypothetical protein
MTSLATADIYDLVLAITLNWFREAFRLISCECEDGCVRKKTLIIIYKPFGQV